MIVFNEPQLRRILQSYFNYYHQVRPHRSLDHNSPDPRPVESPDFGKVIEMPLVGGLHHHYLRQAALKQSQLSGRGGLQGRALGVNRLHDLTC